LICPYFVYMVRCQNGALYTGIAIDVDKRIMKHNSGRGSKSVRAHGLPVKLELSLPQKNKSDALRLEYKIKKLTKSKKEQFINNPKPQLDIFEMNDNK